MSRVSANDMTGAIEEKKFVMSQKRKADCCPICLSEIENVATLECMHTFCSSCIIRHLRTDHRCPVCRQVPIDEDDDEHEEDTPEENPVNIVASRIEKNVSKKTMRVMLDCFIHNLPKDASTEEIADTLSYKLHYETDDD